MQNKAMNKEIKLQEPTNKSYNSIKRILRQQIENKVQTFWTFDEKKESFTQIYRNYNDSLKIYTAQQLIDKLNEKV